MLLRCGLLILLLAAAPAAEVLTDLRPAVDVPTTQVMHARQGLWSFLHRGKERRQAVFVEYAPADWDGTTPLPLVVFLHGAGGRREASDDLSDFYAEFIPAEIRRGRTFPALVLCPQSEGYWGNEASDFLDQALAAYIGRVDPDRVYLIGLSSGGGGTWVTARERRHLLAAAVPVCGIRKSADQDADLVDLPIWAFHNIHDPYQSVAYTRAHVEAIRAAGGRFLRSTEYDETPGKSHPGKDGQPVWPRCHAHAWETAFSDPALWAWLFRQRRGHPERALGD